MKLRKMSVEMGRGGCHLPVFSFSSGRGLTKTCMNEKLKYLLGDFEDENHKISGHSFRAGIPSALASFPDKNRITDILDWGRWEQTETYKKYTKMDRDRKRKLFDKIVTCL